MWTQSSENWWTLALRMVKAEKMASVEDQARELAEQRLVELLVPDRSKTGRL